MCIRDRSYVSRYRSPHDIIQEEIENERLRKIEDEMLEEIEESLELVKMEESGNKSDRPITITAHYDEPDPKLLSDYLNLGRIITYWHMKTLMEDEGYDLNKVNLDALVDLFKKELNDSKLYEDYKRRFSDAMRQDREDEKYV